MSAFDFDVRRSAVPDHFVGTRIHSGTVLSGPSHAHTIFFCEFVHVCADFDLGHADFDKVESLLVNLVRDLDGALDAGEFFGSLASAQGVDDGFGANESIQVRRIAQVITEHLVHGVSQTVSVDVVPRGVDSNSVGVEACHRLAQEVADGFVVSQNFIEDAKSPHRLLFEIADDGNSFAITREDQGRLPREVVGTDEEIQNGIAHAAGLTHEREP